MRWMILSLFGSIASLPLVSGCAYHHHHDRDDYAEPAGYRYYDHDRNGEWDYHHNRWSDEHWDRDRDYDRDREYWRWHRE